MSFQILDFDKNEDKDLSDPLGDISLDDDFYGISNTKKPTPPPKFSKGDHSKKIANIFGLDDTPSDSHVVSKPQDKPPSSASDWLGLTDSPQKKSDDYFGSPQKKSTMENILGSQTNLSQKSTPPTRRKSEVPLNQSKKWEKTLPEYKSLDLGLESGEGQGDSRVQIKENLMDPAVARGSRRPSLKIDSILNFDLASATEDLKKKADGEKSEFNSLDLEKTGASLTSGSKLPPGSQQKTKEVKTQQTKDDLTSFFSMSTTQSRRSGLSRRRETSPDPKTLVDSIEQNYDWLGTATLGQNDTTKKKDFGLPSWLSGPEDEVADTTVKTDVKVPTSTDLADKSQESASEQCAPKEKTNASLDVQTATNRENDIDMDEPNKTTDHPEDNFNKNQHLFSANQDDPLLKDLEQSVGSILDIRSYNKAVQDQNRMINLLIKQQSSYMSRLINRIGAIQGNDELTKHQTTNADNDEQNHQMKVTDLLAEKETLELELKHARMSYEHAVHMLNTKCTETVRMSEERCEHKVAMREEERRIREERWNELEQQYKQRTEDLAREKEEIVSRYKTQLEEAQQEYKRELKTLQEHMGHIKTELNEEKNSKQLRLPRTEAEWNEREVQLMEKEKKMQEQLESIKMKSLQLEERRKEMENDKEEFETKKFRDQNTMNAESKRLKRAHSLLIIEQENWEEEVTKEREQVKKMRQTLEKMRENLQAEQETLGMDKLKLATEKSKIDVLLKMNNGVDLIQSKAEADSMMQVAKATITSVKETKEKLQDEKAKLMDLQQEVILRERMAEKLIRMSEQKQAEGLNALEDAKRIEATFKHKTEAIQQQLAELSIREHKLAKEKFEIQREKELIEKRKEKLFAFLPDLDNTYQQTTIIDPRSIITRLRAEKDIEND